MTFQWNTNENQWKSMKINENQWKPMKINGLRPSTAPGGCNQRHAVRTFFSEIDYGPLHASLALRV